MNTLIYVLLDYGVVRRMKKINLSNLVGVFAVIVYGETRKMIAHVLQVGKG